MEKADITVVQLAALLHDIADHKFHKGDFSAGSKKARAWLKKQGLDASRIAHVCTIIDNISFKKNGAKKVMTSIESQLVQDADRLDALGAIGIARAFAVGAKLGREIHSPERRSAKHKTAAPTTIDHFHEKLLLLKDAMNTQAAKRWQRSATVSCSIF